MFLVEKELLRVAHLKGTVKQKSYLAARNGTFLAEPCRYPHPYHCRSFIRFRCQSSLHQSPIGIKVKGGGVEGVLNFQRATCLIDGFPMASTSCMLSGKFYPEGFVLYLPGRLIGKLFLFICKLHRRYHSTRKQSIPPDIVFFQEEIKRLRTANCIMKQYIRKKRLIPPFLTKCPMILFAFRFDVPHRRIHLYLPISKSTILRYISMVKNDFFGLIMKRSRFFLPVNKTPRDIELLVWQIKEENPSWGYLRITLHLWRLRVFLSPSTVRRIVLRPRPVPTPPRKRQNRWEEIQANRCDPPERSLVD